MICVDVRIEHACDLPAAPIGQVYVDLRFQGGVYDYGLAVGPDDVGDSPLAGAAHLHHLSPRSGQRHVGGVPGEAPGLHPAL
jgi:hypothetical protein